MCSRIGRIHIAKMSKGFPCGSVVKNPPAMQETWVQSLCWEDPLEKEKVTLPTPVFWPGKLVTKSRIRYASKFGKYSSGHRILVWLTGKGQFSFYSKERQCQRMFKLLHNCTHLTHQQSNAQNSPTQVSIVLELTSRCSSWIQKGQRNRKSKRVPEKYLLLLY